MHRANGKAIDAMPAISPQLGRFTYIKIDILCMHSSFTSILTTADHCMRISMRIYIVEKFDKLHRYLLACPVADAPLKIEKQ